MKLNDLPSYPDLRAADAEMERAGDALLRAAERFVKIKSGESTIPHMGAVLTSAYDFLSAIRNRKAVGKKLGAEVTEIRRRERKQRAKEAITTLPVTSKPSEIRITQIHTPDAAALVTSGMAIHGMEVQP
jgi:hypothetical protein